MFWEQEQRHLARVRNITTEKGELGVVSFWEQVQWLMANYFTCHVYKLISELKENWIQLGIDSRSFVCRVSALPLDHLFNLLSAHKSMLLSQELFIGAMVVYYSAVHQAVTGTLIAEGRGAQCWPTPTHGKPSYLGQPHSENRGKDVLPVLGKTS